MKETSYNKKGIPNYIALGTIPNMNLILAYTVSTFLLA